MLVPLSVFKLLLDVVLFTSSMSLSSVLLSSLWGWALLPPLLVIVVVSVRRLGVPMMRRSMRRWVRWSFVTISFVNVNATLP